MRKPSVFLDRDGVINYDIGYLYKYEDFKIKPGVIDGLKFLTKKNYRIFIITNQSGIARGFFTEYDVNLLHKQMLNKLNKYNIIINEIKYCPYHPDGIIKKYKKKSKLRKPGNKMILDILKKWPTIKKKSFMIGDKQSDKKCAKKSNLYFEFAEKNFYIQIKRIYKKLNH